MADFEVLPLTMATWPDFAAVIEGGHGAWGGCWCLGFHEAPAHKPHTVEEARQAKEDRVRDGTTHAALVYDGPRVVGWCQFGSPEELPRIKLRREYLAAKPSRPDWRITCFFVDRDYRHQGVAAAALSGALGEISRLGGGLVESYPEDTEGRSVSSSFLYNASLALFEHQGFTRQRPLGKTHWVVQRLVPALAPPA